MKETSDGHPTLKFWYFCSGPVNHICHPNCSQQVYFYTKFFLLFIFPLYLNTYFNCTSPIDASWAAKCGTSLPPIVKRPLYFITCVYMVWPGLIFVLLGFPKHSKNMKQNMKRYRRLQHWYLSIRCVFGIAVCKLSCSQTALQICLGRGRSWILRACLYVLLAEVESMKAKQQWA